jgi:hypothetical protein
MSAVLSLFRTTNKGIHAMAELPPTMAISSAFFFMSLSL